MKKQHALISAALAALTAGVGHEIRNPLNSALLQLELLDRLTRRGAPRAERRAAVKQVRAELVRIEEVMDELLALGAPSPFKPLRVALRPLLDQVVAELAAAAEERGLALDACCDGEPAAAGDGTQLHRVLTQVCFTILDHTEPGNAVQLTCDDRGDSLAIHVDGGGGPPRRPSPDLVQLLSGDSAFAFAIHNAIIARHRGAIVINQSPRGGVRASVTLPAYAGTTADAGPGADSGRRA